MTYFNPEGRATLKTSILVGTVVACALVVPMASAQDKAAPAKPAMSLPMHAQMSQMQAHMQTMQESMAMMRSMSKPMTMGDAQGGGMKKHDQMMEERMGMMQMMMDQMLQHQQMMESMPAN